MARENSILIIGEVCNATTVFYNEEHKNYRLAFTVKTVRRNSRIDYPRINVYGLSEEEARAYCKKLKTGVFVMVKGMVSTKMVKKQIKCEACTEVAEVDTLLTEVISFHHPVCFENPLKPEDICEMANSANILGVVCTDVVRRDTASGGAVAQYQIAINRKYRVKENPKEMRADYPWVKTFGESAEEDLKRLQKSSQVYIVGALQTRNTPRHITCKSCGAALDYTETVGELAPQDVEYLNNCRFETRELTEKQATDKE